MTSCTISCTDKISHRDYYHRNCTEGSTDSASNFYKMFIDLHEPGDILLVNNNFCDNVKYTVQKGWKVDLLTTTPILDNYPNTVNIINCTITDYRTPKMYNAIALNFLNLSSPVRNEFHLKVSKSLHKGGYLLLEEIVAMPEEYKRINRLIAEEFEDVEILYNEMKAVNLVSDTGMKTVNVLRLLARKF